MQIKKKIKIKAGINLTKLYFENGEGTDQLNSNYILGEMLQIIYVIKCSRDNVHTINIQHDNYW